MASSEDIALLRRWVYGLLIAIALGTACGRIVSAQRVYEPSLAREEGKPKDLRSLWPKSRPRPMPTFSSNDRSRWATIRALVHDHTYVVGRRDPEIVRRTAILMLASANPVQAAALAQVGYHVRTKKNQKGISFEDGWETVDLVMDPDTLEFYSSKPPLLSTLLAGIYWLFHTLLGWSLIDHPAPVVRTMLLLVNALPFAGYLWLLMRLAEAWGKTDWGKLYIVAAGAFATLVTPFLITLNNHTIGTFSVMLAWWSLLRIWTLVSRQETPAWYHFVSAGFFGAFAVTNEMPALSFAVAVYLLLLWWSPARTLLLCTPAVLVVAAGYFGTNYAAIGQFQPVQSEFGSAWYDYEGSHWRKPPPGFFKHGIDWTRYREIPETRLEYAVHVLAGHHGLFSLTPIWLLAVAAMVAGCWRRLRHRRQTAFGEPDAFPWFVQPLGLVLTLVVVGFYLYKSDNYSGWSNGLRWLMWLTPIWLTCLIPLADRLATSRLGRWFAGVLLALSVFSVSYQLWNPWRHPWIYDLMLELGWPGY